MKANFKEQFENLGKIIQSNVSTLKDLLIQSDNLSVIIDGLNGKPENAELKTQLEDLRNGISTSIDTLIEQTKKLFVTYDKLLDEVFKK